MRELQISVWLTKERGEPVRMFATVTEDSGQAAWLCDREKGPFDSVFDLMLTVAQSVAIAWDREQV